MVDVDRRKFTFGGLLALMAAPAAASPGLIPEVQAPNPPPLDLRWTVRREKGELLATLTVHNGGTEPVDVLVAEGGRPGPRVLAKVDGAELPAIVDVDRRDLMSRIGPVPRYAAIAAGDDLELPAYRFVAATEVREVTLTADVLVVGYGTVTASSTVAVGTPAKTGA